MGNRINAGLKETFYRIPQVMKDMQIALIKTKKFDSSSVIL